MPRGPKGEKHLADIVDHAVLVMKIATGELEDQFAQKTPGLLRLVDWAERRVAKGIASFPLVGRERRPEADWHGKIKETRWNDWTKGLE
jgi:hypothetical protein